MRARRACRLPGCTTPPTRWPRLALVRALDLPYRRLLAGAAPSSRACRTALQKVGEIDGVAFYDDSKGTNVGATVAALSGMRPGRADRRRRRQRTGFHPARPAVAAHARAVVLIGRDARRDRARSSQGSGVQVERARDMDEAVRIAFAPRARGDAVLLSPACASFDMFRNYVHRGEVFVAAVAAAEGIRNEPGVSPPTAKSTRCANTTEALLWVGVLLLALGLVMVYSASIAIAEAAAIRQSADVLSDAAPLVRRHLAPSAVRWCSKCPCVCGSRPRPISSCSAPPCWCWCLIPGIGREVNGSRRWLSLVVRESAAVRAHEALRRAVCRRLYRAQSGLHAQLQARILPMFAVMLFSGGLLLREPDFGAFAVIAVNRDGHLVPRRHELAACSRASIVLLVIGFVVADLDFAISHAAHPRLHGSMGRSVRQGYQLSHALIAFGRGEWFGVGLGGERGEAVLPAGGAYRFSACGDRRGARTSSAWLAVIGLFAWLALRAFAIGSQAAMLERYFPALVAQGIGSVARLCRRSSTWA